MAIIDAWINHWFIGIERYNVLVLSYKIIRKEKKKEKMIHHLSRWRNKELSRDRENEQSI